MAGRRWQVVSGVVGAVLVVAGLVASRRHKRPAPPVHVAVPIRDAAVPVEDDAGVPLSTVRGAVIDPAGNRVAGAIVTVLMTRSEAAVAAGARAVWRQQGELGVYSGPMPSARVAARMPSAVALTGRTDKDGSFAIAGVPAGPVIVVAEQPSGARGELEVTVSPATAPVTIQLQAPPAVTDGGAATPPPLPVVVRDARTRATIAAARVTFADGRVHVSAPRYAPADVPVPADARELTVDLELAAQVSGRLLDNRGDPVAGATIEGGGAQAKTDARGEFRLAAVKPGAITVHAWSNGAEASEDITVLPGEQRHDVDLRLP